MPSQYDFYVASAEKAVYKGVQAQTSDGLLVLQPAVDAVIDPDIPGQERHRFVIEGSGSLSDDQVTVKYEAPGGPEGTVRYELTLTVGVGWTGTYKKYKFWRSEERDSLGQSWEGEVSGDKSIPLKANPEQ
ncbi:hypothetical protein [Streptomyces sp. 1222.5]|uniref:hypothetical protein n=1 Tax=Streptomyces sp. 1222.5 TaxID=1881026 RepID=UPI003D7325F1